MNEETAGYSAGTGGGQSGRVGRQPVTEAQRERIFELHLRGVPKVRIAREVGVHRGTVSRALSCLYRELAGERREKVETKLDAGIARMRRIQEQAWADHDRAGDEPGSSGQKSQHLRIALDAEREIARLLGLYEGVLDDGGAAVVVRIERLGPGVGSGCVIGSTVGSVDVGSVDVGSVDVGSVDVAGADGVQ